jgi:sulfite reductase beta subunit-like hemoprotein
MQSPASQVEVQTGTGTLSDPELIQHVPGRVIPILVKEFEDFKREAEAFLAGERPEGEFMKFRLKQGIYGQRQPDVHMVRVKLPFGGITAEQLEALAGVVERYAPLRKGHITTRQNIQLHHVPLRDVERAIRELGQAGLSSREGCGNTIRNVTGDPFAGIAPDELFDMTPYAAAYVRYFIRHPTTQDMPRKVKTAFEGSPAGRVIAEIHDIAFIAKERREPDGRVVRGAQMLVGGGTSIMPRTAQELYPFVGLDDGEYLKIAEALLRVYDRQDWLRPNRARARIKVYVDKYGIDRLREEVERELEGEWVAERDFSIDRRLAIYDELGQAPPLEESYPSPNGDSAKFQRFAQTNLFPQKQPGFVAVLVKVPRGDLTPEQLRGLAAIVRRYTGPLARTTIQQNLLLRFVRAEAAYAVWRELDALGLGEPGASEVEDVVSCPGTDSCKLGITASMGLNKALRERLEGMEIKDPLARKIRINISGCPNGCGQHHLGTIGFYGASIKVGNHTLPAYIPHIGGRGQGGVVFGQRLKLRLPAKRVPEAVERWIHLYEADHNEGEEFGAWAQRVGLDSLEDEVRNLAMPVEFSLETIDQFIDWSRKAPFEVVRGEGECSV